MSTSQIITPIPLDKLQQLLTMVSGEPFIQDACNPHSANGDRYCITPTKVDRLGISLQQLEALGSKIYDGIERQVGKDENGEFSLGEAVHVFHLPKLKEYITGRAQNGQFVPGRITLSASPHLQHFVSGMSGSQSTGR